MMNPEIKCLKGYKNPTKQICANCEFYQEPEYPVPLDKICFYKDLHKDYGAVVAAIIMGVFVITLIVLYITR